MTKYSTRWLRECQKYEGFLRVETHRKHDIAFFQLGSVILPRGSRCSDRSQRNVKARIKAAALGRTPYVRPSSRSR
jgi:hypothetical protein